MRVTAYINAIQKIHNIYIAKALYAILNRFWNNPDTLPSISQANEQLEKFHSDKGKSSISDLKQLPPVQHDLMIIVAAYNMAQYIEECIDSILSQHTRYDFVVRVVNDGSADNTAYILNKYANDPRVEIVSNDTNLGPAAARNLALTNLDSKYIACVDADDKLAENVIAYALDKAYQYQAEVVEVGITKFDDHNSAISSLIPNDKPDTSINEIVSQPTVFIYDRRLFQEIIFPVGYWYEDIIFEALIFPQAKKFISVGEPYYLYRQRENSITKSIDNPKQLDSLYVGQKAISDSIKLGMWRNIRNSEFLTTLLFHIIRMTYLRTCRFPLEIRKSVFVKWNEFLKEIVNVLKFTLQKDKALYQAIYDLDYKSYERLCILRLY